MNYALPISSLGLCLDDDVVHTAIGLRLGAPLRHPHSCWHCGKPVDSLATHGLGCKQSEGHHFQGAAMNDIIHRALSAANILPLSNLLVSAEKMARDPMGLPSLIARLAVPLFGMPLALTHLLPLMSP